MGARSWRRFSALGIAVSLLTACSVSATPSPGAGASSPSQIGGLPPERDIEARAMKIDAAPSPDWAFVASGHLWVAGVDPGLAEFDATTGQRQGGLPIQVCVAMDVAFGSLWVASCSPERPRLSRIDVNSGRLTASLALPGGGLPEDSSVGAGEGGVWVLTSGVPQQLIVVDPRSNKVVHTYQAPENAAAVRAGLGGIWVSTTDPGSVVRLDPATGKVVATVPVGKEAWFLALSGNAVWVMNKGDGTVSRIDPDSNRVVATIKVSPTWIGGGDIAASDRAVWVRVSDVLAAKIDSQTNQVTDRLGPPAGSGSVAIGVGCVWITAHDVGSMWRVPQP